MSARRLVVASADGTILHPEATRRLMQRGERLTAEELAADAAVIDMTGIPNADTRTPLMLIIQEMCDHGMWHEVGKAAVPCWDD